MVAMFDLKAGCTDGLSRVTRFRTGVSARETRYFFFKRRI
jgi:hypothetical protein